MATTTITLTETGTPSRSKGRGWLRVDGREDSFASAAGRELEAQVGDELSVVTGVELRRVSGRTDKERRVITVIVTGDPSDVLTTSIGSPQSYDAAIAGVRAA